MTHFIYQPKSGDRVRGSHAAHGLVIVRWSNGCRHVLGGVRMTYVTTGTQEAPRAYWRQPARAVAAAIVQAAGGVAWDEQGTVSLVVPATSAWVADEWMRATRTASTDRIGCWDEDRANSAALIAAGVARLELAGEVLRAVRARWSMEATPEAGTVTVALQSGRWSVWSPAGCCEAPESWGEPAVEAPLDWTIEVLPDESSDSSWPDLAPQSEEIEIVRRETDESAD